MMTVTAEIGKHESDNAYVDDSGGRKVMIVVMLVCP
jgi:hypothetical protein